MNFWKRVASTALAGLLLLAAGCSGADKTWVYRYEGQTLPAGAYIYTMYVAASEAEEALQAEHADDADYAMPTKFKDLLKETVDGQSVSDYITAGTEQKIKEFFAVEKQFSDRGLALAETDEAYAENTVNSYWEGNTDFYEKNGIAQSSLLLLIRNDLKRQKLFDAIYGEGGESEVSQQELRDIFTQKYAKADVMMFNPVYTDEEIEEQREFALAYLARAQEGEDLYDLIHELNISELEEGEEEPDRPEPGSYTSIVSDEYRSYMGDELIDSIFGAEVGEPVLIEDSYAFYIASRLDILEDEADFLSYRSSILAELKEDEFNDKLTEWAGAVSLEGNEPALAEYTPSWLKMS